MKSDGKKAQRRRLLSAGGIVAPISSSENVGPLLDAGADIFYCGFTPGRESWKFGPWSLENGRDTCGANVSSPGALFSLIDEVHACDRPLVLAMNRTYHTGVRSYIEDATAFAAESGADGFVLTDLKLLEFIRSKWPDRIFIASTFLGIHNSAGLKAARKLGFHRVVLPRPMRLDEIRNLSKGEGPDLEVFVARERCRFVNAYCRLEHALPDPENPGRLLFPASPLCMSLLSGRAGRGYRIEHAEDSLESCGLCAVDALRRLPRVKAFKVVGRGVSVATVTRFVRLARGILDGEFNGIDLVKNAAHAAGIRCSVQNCYYPPPPPRLKPEAKRGLLELEMREIKVLPKTLRAGAVYIRMPFMTMPAGPPPPGIAGLYLGHETCVHLLPSPGSIRRIALWSLEAGLKVSLALPPLFGSRAMVRAISLVEKLAAEIVRPQVTVNDIGALAEVRSLLGSKAEISLGRAMVSQRIDPRLLRFSDSGSLHGTAHDLPWAHLDSFARISGGNRVELSIQSCWPEPAGKKIKHATLHLGPALNAISRACHTLADALSESGEVRAFYIPIVCGRPCLDSNRLLRAGDGQELFISEGNALFARTELPRLIPAWVDRLVVDIAGSKT